MIVMDRKKAMLSVRDILLVIIMLVVYMLLLVKVM